MSQLELIERQIMQLSQEEIALLREKLDQLELDARVPALQVTKSNGKKPQGLSVGIVSSTGTSLSDAIRKMRDEENRS